MGIIRLPLEGTSNTRDIGGYVGSDNKMLKWKKVLRSDGLNRLTETDMVFLKEKYNLKKVIDLRSKTEILNQPNIDYKSKNIIYSNIPLTDDYDPNTAKNKDLKALNEKFFIDLYINILDNKQPKLKEVIEEIVNINADESVLFHCTAGKDRTGVVAMLLLGICGVSKIDIITNYMQTEVNLKYNKNFNESMNKLNSNFPENVVNALSKSDAEFIESTYDYFINKYKSFNDYFLLIGISEDVIEKLKNEIMVEI